MAGWHGTGKVLAAGGTVELTSWEADVGAQLLRIFLLGDDSKTANRLELGAGGGLVGLAIALALGQSSNAHIEITDQIQLHSLMEHNIKVNHIAPEFVSASVLDWGEASIHKQPDVLLAADCVYFEPAFPLLLQTMKQLIGGNTVCYFCFKKRRNADLHFVKDLRKSFRVEDVMDDPDRGIWSRERLFL